MKVEERRLELLQLEGKGFSQPEIVKELSTKYQCSERSVYYDFETRIKWQKYHNKKLMLKVLNRFEYLYRTASFNLQHASHENIKVAWARIMLETNKQLAERFVIPDVLDRLKELEEKARKGVFVQ